MAPRYDPLTSDARLEVDAPHDLQRYVPGLLETLNPRRSSIKLADFLLQSGFAGGPYSIRSGASSARTIPPLIDALRQAIPPGVDGLRPAHARHAQRAPR